MLLEIVKNLEQLDHEGRFVFIQNYLNQLGHTPIVHVYKSGKNIVLTSPHKKKIGIGSHYDTVPLSPGANDNASAIAICLGLAQEIKEKDLENIGIELFFFDEEEKGLIGSKAYLKQFGLDGLIGFINMELVGMGDQFGLWPLSHQFSSICVESFEMAAQNAGIATHRLDRIIMNTADHESFRAHGLKDSFTITTIGKKDIEAAFHYYKAMEFGVDHKTLHEIFYKAPILQHYHKPSDTSKHLQESSLQMTLECIWQALLIIHQHLKT